MREQQEGQLSLWEQVDTGSDELSSWLSTTIQLLEQCAATFEPATVQTVLARYKVQLYFDKYFRCIGFILLMNNHLLLNAFNGVHLLVHVYNSAFCLFVMFVARVAKRRSQL
jgi:hypothetical protein